MTLKGKYSFALQRIRCVVFDFVADDFPSSKMLSPFDFFHSFGGSFCLFPVLNIYSFIYDQTNGTHSRSEVRFWIYNMKILCISCILFFENRFSFTQLRSICWLIFSAFFRAECNRITFHCTSPYFELLIQILDKNFIVQKNWTNWMQFSIVFSNNDSTRQQQLIVKAYFDFDLVFHWSHCLDGIRRFLLPYVCMCVYSCRICYDITKNQIVDYNERMREKESQKACFIIRPKCQTNLIVAQLKKKAQTNKAKWMQSSKKFSISNRNFWYFSPSLRWMQRHCMRLVRCK